MCAQVKAMHVPAVEPEGALPSLRSRPSPSALFSTPCCCTQQGMVVGDELTAFIRRSRAVLVMLAFGEPIREFKISRLMVLFAISAFVVSEAQGEDFDTVVQHCSVSRWVDDLMAFRIAQGVTVGRHPPILTRDHRV